jgi:hypothetical protein
LWNGNLILRIDFGYHDCYFKPLSRLVQP